MQRLTEQPRTGSFSYVVAAPSLKEKDKLRLSDNPLSPTFSVFAYHSTPKVTTVAQDAIHGLPRKETAGASSVKNYESIPPLSLSANEQIKAGACMLTDEVRALHFSESLHGVPGENPLSIFAMLTRA